MDALEYKKRSWQILIKHIDKGLSHLITFAKEQDNFQILGRDDQIILLKRGIFELWLIDICFTVKNQSICFKTGHEFSAERLEVLYGPEFVKLFFDVVKDLQKYEAEFKQLSAFKKMVLFNSTRKSIVNRTGVFDGQLQIANNIDPELLKSMYETMSNLRELGDRHYIALNFVRGYGQSMFMPSPLFREIYDIPQYRFL